MSAQPCSPIMSIALRCSPADRYISAAARGSLLLLAQSACLVIRIRELLGSVTPTNSCKEQDTHTNLDEQKIPTNTDDKQEENVTWLMLQVESDTKSGSDRQNHEGQGRDSRKRVTQTAGS